MHFSLTNKNASGQHTFMAAQRNVPFFKKWVLNDGTSLKLDMRETQIFETSVRKISPSKLQHSFLSIKH